MIATVQSASPSPQPADAQRYLQYQRGLLNLHRLTGIPPSVKVLNGEVTKSGDLPIAGGTYSDIWLGEWLGEKKVAIRRIYAMPMPYDCLILLGRPQSPS